MISLCMIVKDEAEMLPRCLAAAKGLWDELVVVDTGSADGTLDILAAAGAVIVKRPWVGDFAAARNAGLEIAKGDWIVVLDADEVISPELVAQIRALQGDATAGAATVAMRNQLPEGHLHEARLLRVFRRDSSIRFEFPVHEDVSRTLGAFLDRRKLSVIDLAGAIEHHGYVRDRAAAKNKRARDEGLLRGCIERDPLDFYSWFKLLEQARYWNDPKALAEGAAACWSVLRQQPPGVMLDRHYGGDLIVLLAGGLYQEDAAGALVFLNGWEAGLAPSAAFYLRRGEREELAGEMKLAQRDFLRCMELRSSTRDLQLATVRPLLGLARLAMARGDLDGARKFIDTALDHNPRDREALLAALFLCSRAGGNVRVEEFSRAYVAAHGETREFREMRSQFPC